MSRDHKVLVTGNQGYIGTVMEEMMLRRGMQVVGLDAGYFSGITWFPVPEIVRENRKRNQIVNDVRDLKASDLRGLGITAVAHLAALSNDPLGALDPQLTHDVNYLGTVNVARAAREVGANRFVYSSSCSLYGAADTSTPLNEDSKFNPVTAYAQSKVDSERALLEMAAQDPSFEPVMMRNSTAFGLSPRMRLDLVINNLAAYAQTTGQVRVMSDGSPWRPLVHIRDISDAFMKAIELPREAVRGQAFNIGRTENNYTVRDLAKAVSAEWEAPATFGDSSSDKRSYRVDFQKAHDIGMVAGWSIERGVKELKEAYGRLGLEDGWDKDPTFITLLRMQELLKGGKIGKDLRWED